MIRLLSDAHATPFRLSKMGIRNTAHCPFCLAEHGHIKHVIWHCPRFSGLREHWPEPLLQRHHWHECSLNAMVCTRDLPENIRNKWHSFQILVSQLLTQWMTLNRDKNQYEPFLPRSVETPARCFGPASLRNHLSQKIFRNVPLLSLKWQRPATSHAMQRWGGTREDFNSLFSFWSMWSVADVPGRVPVSCWSQAFALFVASGGDASPFAACGQYVGMNIYKFRLLSVALLKSQIVPEDSLDDILSPSDNKAKWALNFPADTAFPHTLWFPKGWNLQSSAQQLMVLQSQIQLEENVDAQVIRIRPCDFIDAISKNGLKLEVKDLDASWSVPRLKAKTTIPPWVSQVLHCREHPESPGNTSISCITQKPLSEWVKLDLGQIRSFIAQPGLRFLAARKRYGVLRQSILDFYKDQLLGNSRRSHVVKPDWTMDFRCFCCHKSINFSSDPRNLKSGCSSVKDISEATYREWLSSLDATASALDMIIANFQ